LLTDSCRAETRQAVKYEGPQTIQSAFQVFGQVAARDLSSNPRVAEGMSAFSKYIDEEKLNNIVNEGTAQ
jgi:hypothetical protein